MDYIAEILIQDKTPVETLSNIISDYSRKNPRYDDQTSFLRFIILQQLNLPKNMPKGKFEKYSWDQLFILLLEEVYELKEELDKEFLNYERILSELGDIGAFCVGLVAKVLEKNQNEYSNNQEH